MKLLAKSTLFLGLSAIGLVTLTTTHFMSRAEVSAPSALPQIIAQVTPFQTDHFLCYQTRGTSVNAAVRLKDQFSPNFWNTIVTIPFRFCNPVKKRHNDVITEIQNPDAHLEMFRITTTEPAPTRLVRVQNQFGTKRLKVSNPILLAVPTRKLPHPTPTNLDHFKCYKAEGIAINQRVDLKDQFQELRKIAVLSPRIFCNPVIKAHNGILTPILHPTNHLVCYKIDIKPFTTTRNVINQFGSATLRMKDADLLCVPSLKLGFSVV